jgi:hypothetical protein
MFSNKTNDKEDRLTDISSIMDLKNWHYYFFYASPRIAANEILGLTERLKRFKVVKKLINYERLLCQMN